EDLDAVDARHGRGIVELGLEAAGVVVGALEDAARVPRADLGVPGGGGARAGGGAHREGVGRAGVERHVPVFLEAAAGAGVAAHVLAGGGRRRHGAAGGG